MQMENQVFYMICFLLYIPCFFADVLLVLGVSGAFMFPFVKLFTKKKIITNIDGLEWKRDKWGRIC